MAMAEAEHARFALAFSSEEGARTAILHLLKAGDRILVEEEVNHANRYYLEHYAPSVLGLKVDFVDTASEDAVKENIFDNTKLLWLESPAGPFLKVSDLTVLSKMARDKGLITVCDNSFANSFTQSPILLGVDIVIQSCEHIDGHSEVTGGVLALNH